MVDLLRRGGKNTGMRCISPNKFASPLCGYLQTPNDERKSVVSRTDSNTAQSVHTWTLSKCFALITTIKFLKEPFIWLKYMYS